MSPLTWIAYIVGSFIALVLAVGGFIFVAAIATTGGAIVAISLIAIIVIVMIREAWVSLFKTKNKSP